MMNRGMPQRAQLQVGMPSLLSGIDQPNEYQPYRMITHKSALMQLETAPKMLEIDHIPHGN